MSSFTVRGTARRRNDRVAAALWPRGATTSASSPRGATGDVDIGFGCLVGMFERNDDVLYVCYDNQGYMNTGVQRSGSHPTGRAHREHQGSSAKSPERLRARASARRS